MDETPADNAITAESLHEAARLLKLPGGLAACANCIHLTPTGELELGWCEKANRPNRLVALCRKWEPVIPGT